MFTQTTSENIQVIHCQCSVSDKSNPGISSWENHLLFIPLGTLSILKWERENPDDGEATDREILCVFYPLKNPIKSLLLWIWCKGKFQKWKWSISVWGEESQKGKRQFFFSAKCPKLISWIQSVKLGGLDQQCWDQQQRMDFLEGMSQGNSVSWRLLLKFPPQSIPGDFSQSSKNRASRIDINKHKEMLQNVNCQAVDLIPGMGKHLVDFARVWAALWSIRKNSGVVTFVISL